MIEIDDPHLPFALRPEVPVEETIGRVREWPPGAAGDPGLELPGFRGFPPSAAQSGVTPVVEPIDGTWTHEGAYGRGLTLVSPPQPQVVALFEKAQFEGPPRLRTIHLFRSDPNRRSPGSPYDPPSARIMARIGYGNGGISNQLDVDWVTGGNIALVCERLNIDVAFLPARSTQYLPEEEAITLGALVGQIGAAVSRPPTHTTAQQVVTAGGFFDFFVPDCARRFVLNLPPFFSLIPPATDFEVLVLSERGGVKGFSTAQTERLIFEGALLPACSTIVRVRNMGMVQAWPASVTFELGL